MKSPSRCSKKPGHGMIYALYDPRDPALPRYVGQTIVRLKQRLKAHRKDARKHGDSWPVSKWINELVSLGMNPIICMIEEIPNEQLGDRERHWILFYRPMNCLTNVADGPYMNGKTFNFSEAHKARFRKTLEYARELIKKPVINESGERYESISAACRAIGLKRSYRMGRAISAGKIYRGSLWRFVETVPAN